MNVAILIRRARYWFPVGGLLVLTGCGLLHPAVVRPEWTQEAKSDDSIYTYRVGYAAGKPSPVAAREAAFKDAILALVKDMSAGIKAEQLKGAKIVPSGIHLEQEGSGYSCWVEIMLPLAEKNRIEQMAVAMPGESTPVIHLDAGGTSTNMAEREIDLGNGASLKLVYIEFLKLWFGKYEVTADQYRAFLQDSLYEGKKDADGNYLKHFNGKDDTPSEGNYPIVWISWNNAAKFCEWLSEKTGTTVRLPAEDEWEKACRAGSITTFYWGSDSSQASQYAWYTGNTGNLQPAGKKRPNAYGLHDMAGNAWEFCAGWFDQYQNSRPIRGGSWFSDVDYLRVTLREAYHPKRTWNNVGFRVVLSP